MYLYLLAFTHYARKKVNLLENYERERSHEYTPLSYKQHSAKTLSRLIVVEGSLNCSIETVPIKKETNQHKITNTLYPCIFIILISM